VDKGRLRDGFSITCRSQFIVLRYVFSGVDKIVGMVMISVITVQKRQRTIDGYYSEME
jgi:hypothetical protein